jgi:PAS domain S-box-containing protein
MRIRTQALIAVAIALGSMVVIGALLAHISALVERTLREQQDSRVVARDVTSLLVLTQEYNLNFDAQPAAQWHRVHASLLHTVESAVTASAPAEPELLALKQHIAELAPLFNSLEETAIEDDGPFAQRRRSLLLERLATQSQELAELRYAWATKIGIAQQQQQQALGTIVLGGPIVLLLVCCALAWVIRRDLLQPLERLQAAATALQLGAPAPRMNLTSSNEVGDAARAFDAMADALLSTNGQLEHEAAEHRRVRQQLAVVLDNVPALIAHIDNDQRYEVVNRAYLAWDHRVGGDIVGHSVEEVHGPANYADLQPYLERALAGEKVVFEAMLTRGIQSHVMRVSYVPEIEADGRVSGVFSMKTDITELRRSEDRLRMVMDASPVGIFTRSPDGVLTYANPAWRRITGRTEAQALKTTVSQLVHPDDQGRVRALWKIAMMKREPVVSEHRYVRTDGRVIWIRGHISMLRRDGIIECGIGVIEDITDRRMVDQALADKTAALARSNEDLERFAYVASHDLQEPLRMVNMFGQLMMQRKAAQLDAEAQEFLGFMVDGGQRAHELVRDLLSLARLDSQAKTPEPVMLESVLGDTLDQLSDSLKSTGAVVTHDVLPTVMGDRSQLGQLLTNLVGNAVKFCGEAAPVVHVSATHERGFWRISVRDNGIGIEPRHFERIFVIFQRLHLRSQHAGTGIGLSICKRVVERHGGRITVESTPGQGSTFSFSLPDTPAPQSMAIATPAAA